MRIPSSAYKAPGSPGSIDGAGSEAIARGADGKKVEGGRDSAANVKRDEVEARIQVSQRARVLATESAIDVAKIERLRGALLRGDLKVDARSIATRIVNGE
ncbi:MAG: flagellar biosynthesis anti-sigma factor FlgM [Deltaproteobacteria bacterium]|nr:flagellar biosynthesis anti-sigma factor FlgM [Deltaproteobacteria bacterium]